MNIEKQIRQIARAVVAEEMKKMDVTAIVRKVVAEEIERADIEVRIRDELKRILLAGVGTSANNSRWAKPSRPPAADLACDLEGCSFVAKSSQGLGRHKWGHGEGGHRSMHASKEDRKANSTAQNRNKRSDRNATAEEDGGGGFKCEETDCDQTFSKRNGLTRHKRETHDRADIRKAMDKELGEKPLVVCGICDDGFKSAHGLRIHQMREHKEAVVRPEVAEPARDEDGDLECGDCDETFVSKRSLSAHRRWNHQHEPGSSGLDDTETGLRPPSAAQILTSL